MGRHVYRPAWRRWLSAIAVAFLVAVLVVLVLALGALLAGFLIAVA